MQENAGNAGKKFNKGVTRLLNAWTQDTSLRTASLNVTHAMLPLLLIEKTKQNVKQQRPFGHPQEETTVSGIGELNCQKLKLFNGS